MLLRISNFLKGTRLPANAFDGSVNVRAQRLVESLAGQINDCEQKLLCQFAGIEASGRKIEKIAEDIQMRMAWPEEKHRQLMAQLDEEKNKLNSLIVSLAETNAFVRKTKNAVDTTCKAVNESVWAEIYNNTVCESRWLTDKALSPGRWAVGYPFLYVMYRVLNEHRPKRILELGLGQSTRMISQYAAADNDVEHYIVENDQEWINYFQKNIHFSPRSKLIQLDLEMVKYKEAESVRVFSGFAEKFQDMQFDLISIDAPLGADMPFYSRINVLQMLPQCLGKSFVMLLDDFERSGEQHTAKEMEEILNANKIAFAAGNYYGAKTMRMWSSPDLKFFCSM